MPITNLDIQITSSAAKACKALDQLGSALGGVAGQAKEVKKSETVVVKSTERVADSAKTASKESGSFSAALRNIVADANKGSTALESIGRIGLKSMSAGLKGVGTAAKFAFKGMTALPSAFGGGLVNGIKNAVSGLGSFFSSIKRIALYRAIRSALKYIAKGFSEGIKNLYSWSNAVDKRFANSMDKIATASLYLKNSLAAMVSPLINALAPAIDFVVEKLVDAFNFVNQFFARITGQSTYTAAKKVFTEWDDAASKVTSSAKDATKEIKKTILGFDEINKLEKDIDKSSGTGGKKKKTDDSASNMFEVRRIESGVSNMVSALTEKLKGMFSIFQQAWKLYGEATINAAKRAFESVKSVVETVGNTFYKVFTEGYGFMWIQSALFLLQTVFNTITAIGNAFTKAWNDDNRGYNYIASIFVVISRINELLANIGNAFVSAWDDGNNGYNYISSILGMMTEVNNLLAVITKSFSNAWNSGIGVAIWSKILSIATSLNNVVANLSKQISKAWKAAGVGESIWKGLLTIVDTILGSLESIVKATENWAAGLSFDAVLNAFDELLKAINPVVEIVTSALAWAYENVLLPLGKWTIESGLPKALRFVSAAFKTLSRTLAALKEPALTVWNDFLLPLAAWSGEAFTTSLEAATGALNGLSDWIDAHTEGLQTTINILAQLALLWIKVKAATKIITGFVGTLKSIAGAASGAAIGISPLSIVLAGLVLIGDYVVENWENIKKAWNLMVLTLKHGWNDLKQNFADAWVSIQENLKGIKEDALGLWNSIKTIPSKLWTRIYNYGQKILGFWDSVKFGCSQLAQSFKDTFTLIKRNATAFVNNLGIIFGRLKEKLKTPLNKVIDLLNSLIDAVENAVNYMIGGINNIHIKIDPWYDFFGNMLWGGIDFQPSIPTVKWDRVQPLATGGIIDRTMLLGMNGNNPVMAGEAGREAILPLENNTEWMDAIADRVNGQRDDDYMLAEYVRSGVREATAAQNDLLREQNNILRQLLNKPVIAEISTNAIVHGLQRKNLRDGADTVPILT